MTGLISATSLVEAEAMRVVRNACRTFMTVDQYEITPEAQVAWFESLDRYATSPYVYWHQSTPIGYGLVRLRHGQWWVSGGLLPEWRGRGHGKLLFGQLADTVNYALGATCWLTVWASNLAAVHTYRSLGFVEDSVTGGASPVITMKRSRFEGKTS